MLAPTDLTHCATFLESLGGLQSVLRHHLAEDAAWQWRSEFLVWFERHKTDTLASVHPAGFNGRTSISAARRSVRDLPQRSDTTAIFHDLWGLPFFVDVISARRRIGLIHCPAPSVLDNLRRNHHVLDGVLCVGWPAVEAARQAWPGVAAERIGFVPVPLHPPAALVPRAPAGQRPFVLGYSGRLVKVLKRADRLPELFTALQQAGLNVRLEILGEGPEEAQLRTRWRDCPNVQLHGRKTGAEYWRILSQWDAIVYLSEVEGLGISLLEAMSCGAVPLHPRIGGGAEAYVTSVRADLLYEPAHWPQLAELVRGLMQLPEHELEALRARSRAAVAPHLGDAYMSAFTRFVTRIGELPRISPERFSARPFHFSDHLPFGILSRAWTSAFVSNGPVGAAS